jgi:hypothetical protein
MSSLTENGGSTGMLLLPDSSAIDPPPLMRATLSVDLTR